MAKSKSSNKNSVKSPKGNSPKADDKNKQVVLTSDQFQELMNRVNAIENARPTAQVEAIAKDVDEVKLGKDGRTKGVIKKYPTEKDFYPDPREELAKLPELKRYAFDENYRLKWDVKGITYETKWGTHVREPVFRLSLYRRHYDEESGEPTDKMLLLKHGIFTEDEVFAQYQAEELGIELAPKELMNTIRFLRFKDWLLAAMNPRPPKIKQKEQSEMVVGGSIFRTEEWDEAA